MAVISSYALALLVLMLGVALWHIFTLHARLAALESLSVTIESRLASYAAKWNAELSALQARAPAKLAIEVGALAEAIDELRVMHRRFAGKVWGRIGQAELRDPEHVPAASVDSELQTLLELQSASSK